MTENILLAVISQAVQSVKRVRSTLLVSVFGSVFVFICVYNTFSWGWMTSGQTYNSILQNWCEQKKHLPNNYPVATTPESSVLYGKFQSEYIQDSNFCKDFLAIAPAIKVKSYLSRKFINVPLTDVVFDVNDLGIFSGVFFCLIMLVLWYNLGLKYANLFTAFKIIDEIEESGKKKTYFDLLSMSQIIAIPDDTKKNAASSFLVYVPYILFSFPFFTCSIIFANDICTLKKVTEMNLLLTINSLILEGVLLVFILILAIGCINLDKKTDKLWDSYEELFTIHDGKKKLNK